MRKGAGGFTLIELLIVVVVIGILAGIAAAKYSEVRSRSFRSVTQTDLMNVVTQQEIYHSDHLSYAPDISALQSTASPGVTLTVTNSSSTGWSAQGEHEGNEDLLCGVYIGTAPPTGGAPASAPDQVICTD